MIIGERGDGKRNRPKNGILPIQINEFRVTRVLYVGKKVEAGKPVNAKALVMHTDQLGPPAAESDV